MEKCCSFPVLSYCAHYVTFQFNRWVCSLDHHFFFVLSCLSAVGYLHRVAGVKHFSGVCRFKIDFWLTFPPMTLVYSFLVLFVIFCHSNLHLIKPSFRHLESKRFSFWNWHYSVVTTWLIKACFRPAVGLDHQQNVLRWLPALCKYTDLYGYI